MGSREDDWYWDDRYSGSDDCDCSYCNGECEECGAPLNEEDVCEECNED